MVEVSIHWTEGTSETAWTALSWPVRVATVAWHNMLFTCIHVVQFYMSNNSAFWRMVFHLLVLYIPNNDGLVLQSNFFEFPLDTFSKGDKLYTPPKTKKKHVHWKGSGFSPQLPLLRGAHVGFSEEPMTFQKQPAGTDSFGSPRCHLQR